MCTFLFNCRIDESADVVSKIVHVYWDDTTGQTTIDNGTLSTDIPIDEKKKTAVETKLRAKHNEITTEKTTGNRRKRSLPSTSSSGPVIQYKVYSINKLFPFPKFIQMILCLQLMLMNTSKKNSNTFFKVHGQSQ